MSLAIQHRFTRFHARRLKRFMTHPESCTLSSRYAMENRHSSRIDIIHLRQDFHQNDVFGDSPAEAITSLMEIVNTTDQGVVKAIQNSNVIKWLLKFK